MSNPLQKMVRTTKTVKHATSRSLPDDIIIDILAWLPAKSLMRFMSLSKTWCALVSDPYFVDLHLNHSIQNNRHGGLFVKNSSWDEFFHLYYPIDFKSLDQPPKRRLRGHSVVGSSNGLVCLFGWSMFYILNPSTRITTRLPDCPDRLPGPCWRHYGTIMGFGCSVTGEYKVVCITDSGHPDNDNKEKQVKLYVYTLGTNSWRSKMLNISGHIYDVSKGNLLNGCFHWLISNSDSGISIMSFDIGQEEFCNVPWPLQLRHDYEIELSVSKGRLNIICPISAHDDGKTAVKNMEIWMMEEYGVRESWTKQLSIELVTDVGDYFVLPSLLQNGEILLRMRTKISYELIIVDPKSGGCRDLILRWSGQKLLTGHSWKVVRDIPKGFNMIDYVESLVSVKSMELDVTQTQCDRPW